jgi:threonine dehydratase
MHSSAGSDGLSLSRSDVEAAAARLQGVAVPTPLLESPLLNRRLGFRLLVKAEPLQRTGSFKFRGAYNTIVQLDDSARTRGVIAYSSGNHGQGVAAAASLLDVPATIVMPSDAPRIKLESTRAWGAEVVLYERSSENREAIGARIANRTGATLIKPYDEPQVIAGQGTIGLEIVRQAGALGGRPDAVLVPCGGGGLMSGIALALSGHWPETGLWTAEPEGFDDTARSLAAGHRVENPPGAASICDALLAPTPGELTFAILRRHRVRGVTVTDKSVRHAMACAFRYFKLVVEPGGAAALAAALDSKTEWEGRSVLCVCSGGNVDPLLFADILRDCDAS